MRPRTRALLLATVAGCGIVGLPGVPVTRPRAAAVVVVDIASTVERVMGGVVNIRTRDAVREGRAPLAEALRRSDTFFETFLFPGPPEGARENRSQGSGFFIRGREYIVTNHHVVRDAQTIEVVVHGRRYPVRARVVGSDARTDIAVLRVDRVDEAVDLSFGRSERTRVGEGVFTIGNPFGYGHTVTSGILSARNRVIGQGPYDDFIQTDAAVNPGNSGGPLFNLRGEVIGINTALLSDARGISFAIPAEAAARVTGRIIGGNKERRAWLGIVSSDLRDGEGRAMGSGGAMGGIGGSLGAVGGTVGAEESFGVVVRNLAKDSPAQSAGLEAGDVILAVDDDPVRSVGELLRIVERARAGKRVTLRVFRSGVARSIEVTLKWMPRRDDLERIEGLY